MKSLLLTLILLSSNFAYSFDINKELSRPKRIGDLTIDIQGAIEEMDAEKAFYDERALEIPNFPGVNPDDVRRGKSYFIPLDITQKDKITMLAAAGAGFLFFTQDAEIKSFMQSHQTETTQKVADFGNFFAEGIPTMGFAIGSYFIGVVTHNDEIKSAGILIFDTAVVAGLMVTVLKDTFSRVRPRLTENPYEFNGPFDPENNKSFPSGHSASAFALATAISMTYGKNSRIIPILAYGAATLTAYARMHENAHWASDVTIGGLIGHMVAKKLIESRGSTSENGITFTPVVSSTYSGFVLEYRGKGEAKKATCDQEFADLAFRIRVERCIARAFKEAARD